MDGKFFFLFFEWQVFFVGKLKFKKTVIMYGKNI